MKHEIRNSKSEARKTNIEIRNPKQIAMFKRTENSKRKDTN